MTKKIKKTSKVNSMDEFAKLIKIDRSRVEQIKKEDPDAEVLEEYNGIFKDILIEYINEFLVDQYEMTKRHKGLEVINTDLWSEAVNIKLFCEWLDNDKKLKLVKR